MGDEIHPSIAVSISGDSDVCSSLSLPKIRAQTLSHAVSAHLTPTATAGQTVATPGLLASPLPPGLQPSKDQVVLHIPTTSHA